MLTNPYFVSIAIPLLLLLCGAIAKKIVRGVGWRRSDFFLGVEPTLAALGSTLVHVYDLQKINLAQLADHAAVARKMSDTATYASITLVLLLFLISTHQDFEPRRQNPVQQLFWLCICSNAVGIALFVGFVLWIKGV